MNSNYQIVIQRPAQMDLDEAFIWYEEKSAGQGFRLIEDFENTLLKICRNPYYTSVTYNSLRAASLSIFPYEIVYCIDDDAFTVIITVFNHFKRKPNWHKKRL
jgi:mRNA-degrading endonuclease RelE of RelBE toxin-antitoxin system